MSYNRKVLKTATKELGKAKAPAKPKDIITDPMGQWKYPGQNTRIPGSDITMQNVPYPVWAQPNVGPGAMMYPEQEYQFPGADYVDEFPQNNDKEYYEGDYTEEEINAFRAGGYTVEDISVPQLTQAQKGIIKNWQEPNVIDTDENTGYNAATGEINRDTRPGSIENNDWWLEHEKFHHLQNLAGGMSTSGIMGQRPNNTVASDQAMAGYYDRRNVELEAQTDAMIKADPNLQFIPRNKLQESAGSFVGANDLMYQDPTTVEGEARTYENYIKQGGKSIFPQKKQGGALLTKKVTCKKCGWKWDAADGGNDMTTCHKCGGEGLVHAKKGGSLKKYSRSIEATNKLFHESLLLKKKKSKKKKIFDPSSSYFQDGGFLPQAQFGANVDENGKPIYYTEEEYRHMSEANERGDIGTESNPKEINEVKAKDKAPDWAKYEKEYLSKQSRDQFIADKKRAYIKRNKNFNRLAGVTMDNFDPRVESEFGKNFDYNKNSYITRRLGKQDHFNPKRRGEWIDELTPTERKIVADSKYGNKLQANLWDRSLAGLQELGNAAIKTGTFGIVNDDVLKNKISGLTKKEQAEIANSNTGALSTFDFANIPGTWAANYLKNRNLSTGSDYKVLPGWSSGELMPNVDQTDAMAMNPLTYMGMGEAMAGKSLLGLGANQLRQLGKTTGLMKEVPTLVKSVADASYMGMRPRKLYSPLNLISRYGKKVEGNITPLGNVLKRTIHNDAIGEPISWGNRTWRSVTGQPIAQNLLKERPGATNNIFSMQVNPTIAGSNISKGATNIPNRLKTLNWNPQTELNYMGKPATSIPLNDAGVSLYRRLPFSNRYASIDPQKLMNNKFQWSTAGSGVQNLAEKYASVAGTMGGIGLGAVGYEALKAGQNPINVYNTVNPLTGNKKGYDAMTLMGENPSFKKFVSEPNPYFIRDLSKAVGLTEEADGGSIEMDIDDDMIQYLLSQGYDVEDIY